MKKIRDCLHVPRCNQSPRKGVRVLVFNSTFNNISVISWRWVLLVEETRVLRVNHRPVSSHWQTLSHNVHLAWVGFELTTLVVIGTDFIGSCKSFQLYDRNHVDPSTQRILCILHQSLLPLPHHWLIPVEIYHMVDKPRLHTLFVCKHHKQTTM